MCLSKKGKLCLDLILRLSHDKLTLAEYKDEVRRLTDRQMEFVFLKGRQAGSILQIEPK